MPDELDIPAALERDLALLPADARAPSGPKVLVESLHVARFGEAWYEPSTDGVRAVPGLRGAGLAPHVVPCMFAIEDELTALTVQLIQAKTALTAAKVRQHVKWVKAHLKWLAFVDPVLEATLAKLRSGRRPQRVEGLVLELAQYRTLLRAHEERLRTMEAFDARPLAAIDDVLAAQATRQARLATLQARRASLAAQLQQYVRQVLHAAELALRDHPQVLREARSPSMRERIARAAATRRRNARHVAEAPDPGPGPA